MKKSFIKGLGASLMTSALVVLGMVTPAHAAPAVNLSTSSGTFNSIAVNSATPAGFTAELAAVTYNAATNVITVGPGMGAGWTNLSTCNDAAHTTTGNSIDCGIQSVSVVSGGTATAVTGWTAFKTSDGEIRLNAASALSYAANDTFRIVFNAGAFVSAQNATVQFYVKTFFNGGGTQDSASAIVTVGTGTNVNNNNGGGGGGGCTVGALSNTYMLQVLGNSSAARTIDGSFDCIYRTATASTFAPANPFTRSGYTFVGWRTAQNVSISVGDPITATLGMPTQLYAVWAVGGSGSSPTVTANMTLSAATGQLVAGSTVAVAASGLQSTAAYTVVVQSTPQTIGSGNAVSGAVNTSVTLPSGLEAGWHTLTFTSTAADGSTVTSVSYFKISASGTLLETTTTTPAELASTGFNAAPYLSTGAVLALAGAVLILFARRRQSS